MKMRWEEPRVEVQKFIPNEYVAACYIIHCETPRGNSSYKYLFDDSNGNGTWDSEDQLLYQASGWYGSFSGCNKWHRGVIRDEAPSANGFVTTVRYPSQAGGRDKVDAVFWWNERLGADSDYHCMVPGDENYTSNPNAS